MDDTLPVGQKFVVNKTVNVAFPGLSPDALALRRIIFKAMKMKQPKLTWRQFLRSRIYFPG